MKKNPFDGIFSFTPSKFVTKTISEPTITVPTSGTVTYIYDFDSSSYLKTATVTSASSLTSASFFPPWIEDSEKNRFNIKIPFSPPLKEKIKKPVFEIKDLMKRKAS